MEGLHFPSRLLLKIYFNFSLGLCKEEKVIDIFPDSFHEWN